MDVPGVTKGVLVEVASERERVSEQLELIMERAEWVGAGVTEGFVRRLEGGLERGSREVQGLKEWVFE